MSRRVKVIGMIHMPALPGSPGYDDSMGLNEISIACENDLSVYMENNLDGVIFENFGDVPFYSTKAPPETISSMTWIIEKCISNGKNKNFQIGVNVLRNDPIAALAIAKVVGGSFIRVNIHSGASVTDQGIIEGRAHETLRYRKHINGEKIEIFADVRVKHASPLISRSITQESIELVERGMADCLIFTGNMTGEQPADNTLCLLPNLKEILPGVPLYVGSGVNEGNVEQILDVTGGVVDGFIIGTAFKKDGNVFNPVERERVSKLLDLL